MRNDKTEDTGRSAAWIALAFLVLTIFIHWMQIRG